MSNKNDWDGDGIANNVDLTPGEDPNKPPLSMPQDAGVSPGAGTSGAKNNERPSLSLSKDYPAEEEENAPASIDSSTQPIFWNTNQTPVRLGGFRAESGGQYPTYDTVPFFEAARYSNQLRGMGRGTGSNEYNDFVNKLRIYTNSRLGTDSAVDQAWANVLIDAQESGVPALDLLDGVLSEDGSIPNIKDRLGSSASVPSTRETVTLASERDLRTTADAIASEVLGRGVTDNEFRKVLKKIRLAERTEPTITTTGLSGTVSQSGLTAEGRSSIIQEALMQGPEAEDFGKATKMMDLFYSALEARPEGA